MTNLLDLPPELFQQIIHEVVKTGFVGILLAQDTWRLRGVCRVFAVEIQNDFLTKHDSEFMGGDYAYALTRRLLVHYLVGLFRSPQDVNKPFLLRLKNMGAYIIVELDITDTSEKANYIYRLCVGLQEIIQYESITHGLWCKNPKSCLWKCSSFHRQDIPIEDKICAAIALGAHDLLEKLLPEFVSFRRDNLYEFKPIIMALRMSDQISLDIILRFLAGLYKSNRELALEHMTHGRQTVFFLADAITYGIELGRTSDVEVLLKFHQRYLPPPPTASYDFWIYYALDAWKQGKDTLTPLLKFRPGMETMVSRRAIIFAYEKGGRATIEKVLNEVEDINEGSILTLPIFIAVRSNRPIAVEAAANVGADVDIQAASNLRRPTPQPVTPIELAIHRKAASIVEALIEAGASIPHMSMWPRHKSTFHVLYTNASKQAKVPLPTWKEWRKLNMDERQALRY